jgi:adenosine deaminase
MPSLYQTTLSDEYLAAIEFCEFSVDEVENLALNAVRTSFMAEDTKTAMLNTFTEAYADLRVEHLAAELPAS